MRDRRPEVYYAPLLPGRGYRFVLTFAAILSALSAAGCSSTSDSSFTFLADPGQFDYYTCDQIASTVKGLIARQQELKSLIDKADESAGGAAVGLIAYRTEYVNVGEQLRVADKTARRKSCIQAETWGSNAAVR
jgi:outer membrane murein-binding lipoprotein Lpp